MERMLKIERVRQERGRATLASLAILAVAALVGHEVLARRTTPRVRASRVELAQESDSVRSPIPALPLSQSAESTLPAPSPEMPKTPLEPAANEPVRVSEVLNPLLEQEDAGSPTPPVLELQSASPPPPILALVDPAPISVADSNTTSRPRRARIRDSRGRVQIARLYGDEKSNVVLLPDGQLGWPKGLAFTDDPFVPETADEIAADLLQEESYRGFDVLKTAHYVVLFGSRPAFAQASAQLLESLHDGLLEKLRAKGLDVHPAEFPLVAIIFADEEQFRAASRVPEDVQAYYNVLTNRIYFYETSERDQNAPDVAARKRPQTVAHEGTHQILQNIGLHPRLANWPLWLVEGLAEYFAPTTINRDGSWDGANKVNPFHMATIRDIQDPLVVNLRNREPNGKNPARGPRQSLVESLVTSTNLTAIDYAWSWALTHYLANKRFDEFLKYLQDLSRRSPQRVVSPADHLADFRAAFGSDLGQVDKALAKYLAGLKHFEAIPYYAVTLQQPLGNGTIRRAAMVSQSPAMIRQWVEEIALPQGGPPIWHAQPFPTRTRARLAAEGWINGL